MISNNLRHYIITPSLTSISIQGSINMMRACDCPWLLGSNILITRLQGQAYQGVQLFPSATASVNKGWGMFTMIWWACWGCKRIVFMYYHPLHRGNEMQMQRHFDQKFIDNCKTAKKNGDMESKRHLNRKFSTEKEKHLVETQLYRIKSTTANIPLVAFCNHFTHKFQSIYNMEGLFSLRFWGRPGL